MQRLSNKTPLEAHFGGHIGAQHLGVRNTIAHSALTHGSCIRDCHGGGFSCRRHAFWLHV